jgi:PAS domain S-box-containing protein
MEGHHNQEPMTETVHLPKKNRQMNGHSDDCSLAAQNAKLAEENAQLARERDLLRTMIDGLPDLIYVKDCESRFLINNLAHTRLLGADHPDKLVNKTDFDCFPKEFAERYFADDQAVIQSGQAINHLEPVFDNATKETRWVQTTKIARRDSSGKIIGLIGISRDVTELKRAKDTSHEQLEQRTAQLSRERLLLRTLIDNLPDCIYAKDTAGRKILANPADLKNLHCATESEAIGKTDFDLFPAEIAEKFWADDQKVIRGESVINREEYFFNEEGQKCWLLTSKLPLRDQDGNLVGLVGIGRNITKQKQAEDSLDRERILLRTLIDRMPDAIYIKDKEGRFVLNNAIHAQRRCEKSPADMKGKTDFDYFPKEIAGQFFADEQKIMQTGQPLINQEQYTSIGTAPGVKRWMVVSKVLWQDDQGNILGTIGITRDVHEFKMAREALQASEEKLRESAAQLERSNRELQDFAYVASHDLQEPLRKIVVFGERLKEKAADRLEAETLDYLQRMQNAASRMQTLINDLLTFSRVTTKAHPLSTMDLARTAQEVLDDLESRIENTKGRVEVGPLPAIEAEPLQMRQLFQNLIGNALKFRRPDVPPVVKIEAKIFSGVLPQAAADAPEQKLCELTVSDNGIGFDEKYLDRIFNVFQRLHTRNEYEGTGMGLAIARKIVLYHGGAITAKSAPEKGATFIVTLPVAHPKTHNNGTTDNKL